MEKIIESENIIYIKVNENLIDEYLSTINDTDVQSKISHTLKTYTKDEELE